MNRETQVHHLKRALAFLYHTIKAPHLDQKEALSFSCILRDHKNQNSAENRV